MDKHLNGNRITWEQLTNLCTAYARARVSLREGSDEIREAQRIAAKDGIQRLRRLADVMAGASEQLRHAVTQANAQGMFQSPRARVFDGIRVGVRDNPGTVEIDDEGAAVARIRAAMPDCAGQLLRTRESLDRAAPRRLSAEDMKLLGVRIVNSGEEIVARPVQTDLLEGWVEALLADAAQGGAS